jgi:hypothetical protein
MYYLIKKTRYTQGEGIVEIAECINIAPCLLARFILQCNLGFQKVSGNY